jgi:S-DNA-T family DNA segregation ATPase FtsK/SpoIIIE
LARRARRFASDLLLSLFGPPAGLLLPLIIVLGLRLARGAEVGRWGRALSLTLLGIVFMGTATALLFNEAVNGLPASWGGALGLSLAQLIGFGITSIGQPDIAEPFRVVAVGLTALTGLFLWYLGLGLRSEERTWLTTRRERAPRLIQDERPIAEKRREEPAERPARTPIITAPEPPRTVIADRAKAGRQEQAPSTRAAAVAGARRHLPPADDRPAQPTAAQPSTRRSTRPAWSGTRGCWSRCSRTSRSRARSWKFGRDRS